MEINTGRSEGGRVGGPLSQAQDAQTLGRTMLRRAVKVFEPGMRIFALVSCHLGHDAGRDAGRRRTDEAVHSRERWLPRIRFRPIRLLCAQT